MEKLKVGDFVCCFYSFRTGTAYGKVLKIHDLNNNIDCDEYGPIITGRGDENSKLKVTVKILGYDMGEDYGINSLGEIVEDVEDTRELDIHNIFYIIDEKLIREVRTKWENLMKKKLDFFYKNINRDVLSGRKMINGLNMT